MRSFLILICSIFVLAACKNDDARRADMNNKAKDTTNFTTVKWIDSLKDIGTVPAGKNAEINFRFQNTGDKPLYVIDAKPGCGCTVADFPKEAILPGKEGLIKANYNVHKDGQGEFRKSIHITTNTKEKKDTYIFFYGIIKTDSLKSKNS